MPQYVVTDPTTGRRVRLSGDSPPTEAEIAQVFASLKQAPPPAGPDQPFGGLGITTVSDEDWARLTPQQKLNGVLEAMGKALAPIIGLGPGAVEHPKTTLASMAVPAAIGAGAGPVARTAGALLQKPAVGATIGAIEGYQYGDLPGAAIGALAGAAGSKAGQALRGRGPQPVPRQASAAQARAQALEQTLRSGSVDDVLALGGRAAPVAAAPPAPVAAGPMPFKYGKPATGPAPRIPAPPPAVAPPAPAPVMRPAQPSAADIAAQRRLIQAEKAQRGSRVAASPASPAVSAPATPVPAAAPSVPRSAPSSPAAPTPSPASQAVAAHDTAGRTLHTPWAERTAGQRSVQSVRNDLGIAAKRAKVELSEPQMAEAAQLVRDGKTPVEAVAEMAGRPAAAPVVKPPVRMRLNADETWEYARLVQAGKSDLEAKLAIAQQRELVTTTGATPLPKARSRVASRQATGRWPQGTP